MRRDERGAGGVVKLGSAIGEVCCACARGAAANSATNVKIIVSFSLFIPPISLLPLIPAQAGIQQLGPRLRGDER